MLGVLYLSINIQLPDSLPVQVQRRHVSMHPWSVCRDIFFQGPNARLSIRLEETRNGRPFRQDPTGSGIYSNWRHNLVDTRSQIAVRQMLQTVANIDGHLRWHLPLDRDE